MSVIAGVVTEFGKQHAGIAELGQVAHAGRVEATDQVIALVLHHPGMKALSLALDRPPLQVQAGVADTGPGRADQALTGSPPIRPPRPQTAA